MGPPPKGDGCSEAAREVDAGGQAGEGVLSHEIGTKRRLERGIANDSRLGVGEK